MPGYDALFLDIDGTLVLPDHSTISPRTLRALEAARDAGVTLCIATGRCRGILPAAVLDFGFDYAILSNGAALLDLHTGKTLHRHGITAAQAALAYPVIRRHADFIEWFADGEILLTKESYALIGSHELPPWHAAYFAKGNSPVADSAEQYFSDGAPGLEKINIVRYTTGIVAAIREELEALDQFTLSSSISRSLEINSAGCSKAAAIRALCALRGFSLKRTAACGDGGNDLEMLCTVGCGAAMGNAKDSVKASADCVTGSNEEDGAAEFIERYIL